MLDSELGNLIFKVVMPKIEFNQMIFIPRLANHVLGECLYPNADKNQASHYIHAINKEPCLSGSRFSLAWDPEKVRVPVRVLSRQILPRILVDQEKSGLCGCHIEKPLTMPKQNKLILHVHGGGFIAMSSYSHQNYTRV